MKKFYYFFVFFVLFCIVIYFSVGFYLAHKILKIDHTCGEHQGSLPNTWSVKVGLKDIKNPERIKLRTEFESINYHVDKWENVNFVSRDSNVNISGWLFNYYPNKPVVIVVHGIFPNGKCNPEPNLIASLLVKNNINALTIDLRNYGQSTIVSQYENLGLTEYLDILGAFDFLQTRGFKKYQIGLLGISLGASTVIFAASYEPAIKAIWSESSLAEFDMVLTDEIGRYGFPNIFGPAVSLAGKLLTGINPNDLNPIYTLSDHQNYFFTHGGKDQRMYVNHFNFIKSYATANGIKAEYWLVHEAGHIDLMLMHPEEYGSRMKIFFEKNLRH